MKKSTIGLIGYYSNNSWGDDVMGLLFYSFLIKQDCKIIVFTKSNNGYICKINERESDINSFVDNVDFIVYGGGGCFVSGQPKHSNYFDYIEHILNICIENNIRIYCFSVGSSKGKGQKLNFIREKLLEQSEYLTVRNPQDIFLLDKYGKRGKYYHDIMWLFSEFFNVFQGKENCNERLKICINAQSRLFKLLIILSAIFRTDFHFYFINSSVGEKCIRKDHFAILKHFRIKNIEAYHFFNLNKDLVFLSEMDVIISCKLHLGIAFMSMNKPFFSVDPKNKTKMMMSNLRLNRYIFCGMKKFQLILKLILKYPFLKLIEDYRINNLSCIIQSARKHLEELSNIIDLYNTHFII